MKKYLLLLLLLLCVNTNHAQENPPFVYAYISAGENGYTFYVIDPANGSQTILPDIIPANHFVDAWQSSPDGQWLALELFNRQSEAYYLRLINLITGETRDIMQNVIVNQSGLAWSDNGQKLAILSESGDNYPATFRYNFGIYSVSEDNYSLLRQASDTFLPYELVWQHGNHSLVVISQDCSVDPCISRLELGNVVTGNVQQSQTFNSFGDRLCNIQWSPDNQYLSFSFSCGDGLSISLAQIVKEVFVWNISNSVITELTDFTPPFNSLDDLEDIQYGSILFADAIWLNNASLIVGYSVEPPDAVNWGSAIYGLDNTILPLSSNRLRDFAFIPQTTPLAFREEVLRGSLTTRLEVESANTIVANLDGTTLQPIFSGPPGCDLSWSPDGQYLAYTAFPLPFVACDLSVESIIVYDTQADQSIQSPVPADTVIIPVGWLQKPSEID